MFKRGLIGGPFSLSRDKILPLAPTLSHLNSHGYLGMTAAMTQVSVPVTKKKKEKNLAVLQKKRIFAAKKKQTSH
jgi:hypothetical protein